MASPQSDPGSGPLKVDVVPSGFEDPRDLAALIISILNLLVTLTIPVVVWWYGRQQQMAQDARQAKQCLQAHVERLSSTDAMEVIGTFKDGCAALNLNYGAVSQRRAATPNAYDIRSVDAARKQLQGIWDNIMEDYRNEELGGKITDRQHGRMLRRGLVYMELVEPLEAANWAKLESSNARLARNGPYTMVSNGVNTAGATQAAVDTATTELGLWRHGAELPIFCDGARPSRFKWLENQKTIQLVGMPLWLKDPLEVQVVINGNNTQVKVHVLDAAAIQRLRGGPQATPNSAGHF